MENTLILININQRTVTSEMVDSLFKSMLMQCPYLEKRKWVYIIEHTNKFGSNCFDMIRDKLLEKEKYGITYMMDISKLTLDQHITDVFIVTDRKTNSNRNPFYDLATIGVPAEMIRFFFVDKDEPEEEGVVIIN